MRGALRTLLGACALLAVASAGAQSLPLWELSKGERVAYLAGSLHIGTPEMFPLPPPMRKVFEFAEVVAVELDSSDAATQKAVTDAGVYPEGMTLDKEIGAAEWEKLKPVIERIGLRRDVAQREKPWLLVSTMTLGAQARAGYSPDLAIDAALARAARANNKQVVELERFVDTAALLEELARQHGKTWLARVAQQIETGKVKENIEQTVAAWRAGDLQDMQRIMEAEVAGDPVATEIATRVGESRSEKIASRIDELFGAGKRTEFVVHFANLAGPNGVVARLRKAGYRVRQLTLDSEVRVAPPAK